MNTDHCTRLKAFGRVKLNEPLAKHTTFKIGGPADIFVTVESTDSLVGILKYLNGEGLTYIVVGGGSNMLVNDEGYRGVVIKVDCRLSTVDGHYLIAEAGCITVEIARESIKAGLTGFEWGVGVPGTIGGAVRGNAGAMGGQMNDVIEKVEVYRDGEIIALSAADCAFAYRDSVFKHNTDVIVRVTLGLQKTDEKSGMKKALEYLQYRNKTQPQGYSSTGCIFKNVSVSRLRTSPDVDRDPDHRREDKRLDVPEEFLEKGFIPAGWLVERAGMKGKRVGRAQVSERHGNFVVNLGGATASDVHALIEEIKEKVYDTCGIEIEEEIQLI